MAHLHAFQSIFVPVFQFCYASFNVIRCGLQFVRWRTNRGKSFAERQWSLLKFALFIPTMSDAYRAPGRGGVPAAQSNSQNVQRGSRVTTLGTG
jgi:hypothetical protein